MNTNETKARAAYDAALADADQWRQTVAQLGQELAAAEAETPGSPTDLAKIADRQVSLAKQLEMARGQLGIREAAVLDAGRAIVAAEADDLQPDIDKAQKQIDVIDKKTAELRAAVDTHVRETREAHRQAEAELRKLSRVQGGLRAAVEGEGVREHFRTLDDLPASLHPQTGILPQASFQRDIDEIEAERDRESRLRELNEMAAKFGVKEELGLAWNDLERPGEAWLADLRSSLSGQLSERSRDAILAVFDRAVELDADAASLSVLAKWLTNPKWVDKQAKAIADHFARVKEEAAAMFGIGSVQP